VVKAALHFIGARAGQRLVSGQFLVESESCQTQNQTPFLFADCAVIPEPSSRSLAMVALAAADSYKFFTGQDPRVALLSFSTRGSAEHDLVDRIREALEIIKKQAPALHVDGEIQADAALDFEVAKIKNAGNSSVAGQANVLVFPTLEAGNIAHKLVQRFSPTRVAGPFLWGLDKPLSDLSRGCTVQEVTDTAMCLAAMIRGLN
jgi:phosphate acetyltransferase